MQSQWESLRSELELGERGPEVPPRGTGTDRQTDGQSESGSWSGTSGSGGRGGTDGRVQPARHYNYLYTDVTHHAGYIALQLH